MSEVIGYELLVLHLPNQVLRGRLALDAVIPRPHSLALKRTVSFIGSDQRPHGETIDYFYFGSVLDGVGKSDHFAAVLQRGLKF